MLEDVVDPLAVVVAVVLPVEVVVSAVVEVCIPLSLLKRRREETILACELCRLGCVDQIVNLCLGRWCHASKGNGVANWRLRL